MTGYYPPGEVELGVRYVLVITTNAGLWRYKIGDVVQFTSLSPYRSQIAGRTKHYINAFGEELVTVQTVPFQWQLLRVVLRL